MPSARTATRARSARRPDRAAARVHAPANRARPQSVPLRLPISRIKWDRAGRTVMLVVLGLVAYLGIKGMLTLLSTHAQAEQQQAIVRTLARQNKRLEQLQRSLSQPATIIRDARSLGMVKAGERSYSVSGLPGD